jgi:hypothetical protein
MNRIGQNFIPTNHAHNDEALVEHQGDTMVLGFYGQDGKTAKRHGMTVEAARQIAMEMLTHCDQVDGTTTVVIDLDRVIEFANPDETLVAFAERVKSERSSGGTVAWTENAANVGRIA